jgi:hypothetical protein
MSCKTVVSIVLTPRWLDYYVIDNYNHATSYMLYSPIELYLYGKCNCKIVKDGTLYYVYIIGGKALNRLANNVNKERPSLSQVIIVKSTMYAADYGQLILSPYIQIMQLVKFAVWESSVHGGSSKMKLDNHCCGYYGSSILEYSKFTSEKYRKKQLYLKVKNDTIYSPKNYYISTTEKYGYYCY